MSSKKDAPLPHYLERSDSFKLANGHDALKRGREGEPDEELGMTNKRPDLRNPFSKPDASLNFEEDTLADDHEDKNSAETRTDNRVSSTLTSSHDSNDWEDVQEEKSSVTRKTSTPSALLRRMSLENQRSRTDYFDQNSALTSLPEKTLKDDMQENQDKPLETSDADTKEDRLVAPKDEIVKADTGMTTEPSSSEVEAVTEIVSDKPKEESVMAPPSFVFGRSLESRVEKVERKMDAPSGSTFASLANLANEWTGSTGEGTSGAFVFGQNLSSRVANAACSESLHLPTSGLASDGSIGGKSASGFNGLVGGTVGDGAPNSSGFLFSDTLKQLSKDTTVFGGFGLAAGAASGSEKLDLKEKKEVESQEKKDVIGETLQETANREYQAKQQKPVLEEVDVVTGEESERNVFEVSVKLHVFDKDTEQWKERGRAIARLNDADDNSYSRLVIRMAGTLRIIINTNVWKDMVVNRLSDKNVSFSAFDTTDDNALKVFLISCSPDNADHIFEELKSRIARIKALHPSSPPRPLPVVREKISPTTADAAASTKPDQPIKKPKIQESN